MTDREKIVEDKEATMRCLLEEWLELHDTPCRRDHHGYCQEHFLEENCIVYRTKMELQAND